MAKSRIFAVVTAAGTVTRASSSKVYTHAVVRNEWPITWCSRLDLAQKAQRQNAGSVIMEVTELAKQPADKYPSWKTYRAEEKQGDRRYSVYMVQDPQGAEYIGRYSFERNDYEYSSYQGEEVSFKREEGGYLEKMAIMYGYKKNSKPDLETLKRDLQKQCAAILNNIHDGDLVTNHAKLVEAIGDYNKAIIEQGAK